MHVFAYRVSGRMQTDGALLDLLYTHPQARLV